MLVKQKDVILEKIKSDGFFSQFDEKFLGEVSEILVLRKYSPNQVIYFPYEPANHIFLVHKGRVRITKVLDEQRRVTFRHAIEGDFFGEEGVFGIGTRDTYAESIHSSEVWIMPAKKFKSLLTDSPEFALIFSKKLYLRTVYYENSLLKAFGFPIMARLVSHISSEVKRLSGNKTNILKITHQELANILGARRETISVCLKELECRGFIEKRKGSIIIKDIDKMERWCERNYVLKNY